MQADTITTLVNRLTIAAHPICIYEQKLSQKHSAKKPAPAGFLVTCGYLAKLAAGLLLRLMAWWQRPFPQGGLSPPEAA